MNAPWQPNLPFNIQILEIDSRPIGSEWDAQNVCSSFWRLYVNKRDGAWIELKNGKRYPLRAQQVYLLPAWVGFTCHNDQPIDHFYIHFDLTGLPGILIRQLFPEPLELTLSREASPLLRTLQSKPWRKTPNTVAIAGRIQSLLHLALSHAWDMLAQDSLKRCETYLHRSFRFAPVLQYIETHLDEPLQNVQLAQLCHLSRDYFVRSFANEIGQTPAHYIRECRVAKAAQLLRFTQESIEHIAQQCGFADRFHFSRVFSRIMNAPPATYRQAKQV